jgi:hypothetical protein
MFDRTQRVFLALLALSLLGISQPAVGQTKSSAGKNASTNYEKLAKRVDWGTVRLRLFHDIPTELGFTLATSWIPGEDRKGMFRFRVEARPAFDRDAVATIDATEKLLNRADTCDLYLRLNDTEDFELRTIPLRLEKSVNSSLMLVALSANSSAPMSATEYRSFLGVESASGTWTVTWNCHDDLAK